MSNYNHEMMTSAAYQQALLFARRLDADDFDAVKPLLAPDCQYDTKNGILIGPEAIVESYRSNSQGAQATLDSIEYESEVVESGEKSATVLFTDRLTHRGFSHIYRSLQHLTFGPDMTMVRIESEELPGERERLNAFFQRCGIKR